MRTTIAILGVGQLGKGVARVLHATGVDLAVWDRDEEACVELAGELSSVRATQTVLEACAEAQLVMFAVPVSAMRSVATQYGEVARGDQVVVHGVRGVEPAFVLPHEILREETCVRKIAVLGGPMDVPELTGDRPLAVVLASRFDEALQIGNLLGKGSNVHVHTSYDLVGVEVAGAIANVSALAAGMVDGAELGETARGVILTVGLNEAARLGAALGAQSSTFAGLAGVGELIPRKISSTRRHLEVGARLARGETLAQILDDVKGEVEGIITSEAAVDRARRFGMVLPLMAAVHDVCEGRRSAAEALGDVLSQRWELEGIS